MSEAYLDSLPEDTEEINVSNKGIKSLDVTRFKNLKTLNCNNNQLTSLHLNEKLDKLSCYNNQLTSLDSKNLQTLYCHYNQLTSLHLNENLQVLFCDHNQLTSLHLNEKLKTLYCSYNQFTSLHLNEKLEELYCYNNQLTSLHLNENLQTLNCSNNQLTSLHLNEKIQTIVYNDNPIYEIINSFVIDIIKRKIRLLNQFRHLYYSLKYKNRFRDLLWVKIREPKIRKKYSHDYLVANLHEETDLDELLNNW